MWWAAAIQGGLSLFGALSGKSAARKARRIAGYNAEADWEESVEKMRRMRRTFREREGMARAIAAGSGLSQKHGDSQSRYIASMVAEHGHQLRFEGRAARSRRKIIKAGGQLAYRQGMADVWAGFGQAIGQFGQAWGTYPRKSGSTGGKGG